jgi:hypothetical protein
MAAVDRSSETADGGSGGGSKGIHAGANRHATAKHDVASRLSA